MLVVVALLSAKSYGQNLTAIFVDTDAKMNSLFRAENLIADAASNPSVTQQVSAINYDSGAGASGNVGHFASDMAFPFSGDRFAGQVTGNLTVTESDYYSFVAVSDDGVRLTINNQVVLEDDDSHPPKQTVGSIFLDPGVYPVEVLYFQDFGGATVEISAGKGLVNPWDVDYSELVLFDGTTLTNPLTPPPAPLAPEIGGSWGDVIEWPEIAVASAQLPDGRILTWSSTKEDSSNGSAEYTHASIFNPDDESFQTPVDNNRHNNFCPGISLLEDGSIVVSGGGATVDTTSRFDIATMSWVAEPDMIFPRWYPTNVTMPDNQVFSTFAKGAGESSERFTGSSWVQTTGADMADLLAEQNAVNNAPFGNGSTDMQWYGFMHVAPNGKIAHTGPTETMHWFDPQGNGGVENMGARLPGDQARMFGSAIMYDIGKILVSGGNDQRLSDPSSNRAISVDVNGAAPVATEISNMTSKRTFHDSVVLPDGKVLVIGGTEAAKLFSDEGSVFAPEIWDPATDTWTSMTSLWVPRNYHSTALLLKDGRVLSAGGGVCDPCDADHQDGQIFSPPYLFDSNGNPAARPSISSAPATTEAGEQLTVSASNGIAKFAMIRLSGTTHSINTDQRYIPLVYSDNGGGNYSVDVHANPNVMIPGYYWLFAVDANGVPSVGHTIQVQRNLGPDTDGDGVPDANDAFPNDPNEWADTDGDGVGDNADAFPNDPNETVDTDGDGIGDNSDPFPNDPTNGNPDADGDGVPDANDAFPNDPNESADTDGDGVGDNADAFPNDPNETVDTDGDGIGDNSDPFPNDPTNGGSSGSGELVACINAGGGQYTATDGKLFEADVYFDGGRTSENVHAVAATEDDTLYHTTRWKKFDYLIPVPAASDYSVELYFDSTNDVGEHVFDVLLEGDTELDDFDIRAQVAASTAHVETLSKTVSDGVLDIKFKSSTGNAMVAGICVYDGEPTSGGPDTDGDGVPDANDAFPNDPNEWADTDGDGVGDNADAFPNDPNETVDTDGDGIGDNSDPFPNDPTNGNPDADGDGVPDANDAFPNDPNESADTDGDGVGDNADAFPNDPNETVDTDGDGIGDNSDPFPNDPTNGGSSGSGELVACINAGGGQYTATDGKLFEADVYFDGGRTSENVHAVAATEDDTLYHTTRWKKFDYLIPVPAASDYSVELYFDSTNDVGEHVFDVLLEGDTELDDFDIRAQVAASTAHVETLSKTVSDGVLDIKFKSSTGNAMVAGICVYDGEPTSGGPDTDGDGVPDANDAFPNDPNEWADTDGDGVGDNADAFPNDPNETVDTDGDGIGDNSDPDPNTPNAWQLLNSSTGSVIERHEHDYVRAGDSLYLVGGRSSRQVQSYDPTGDEWSDLGVPTDENSNELQIHHFQAAEVNGTFYVIGAFEGSFPAETPVANIYSFDQATPADWTTGPVIPVARQRGSAAVAEYQGKLYIVGGNTQGHNAGAVAWFDEYDPATQTWTPLTDAPHARDHHRAAVVGSKLYVLAGRRSSVDTGNPLGDTESVVDVYDFVTGQWSSLVDGIPTPRGGVAVVNQQGRLVVIGGENTSGALASVEVLDVVTEQWSALPSMVEKRNAPGAALYQDKIYVASGRDTSELASQEVFDYAIPSAPVDSDGDGVPDESDAFPNDPTETTDTDGDGVGDNADAFPNDPNESADSDGDGIGDNADLFPNDATNGAATLPIHSVPVLSLSLTVWNVNPDNDSVSVIDIATNTLLAEIAVGDNPHSLAMDYNSNQMWVTNKGDASIAIIDVSTLAVDRTLLLDNRAQPHGIVIKGTTAYVALEATGDLLKIDTQNDQELGRINLGPHIRHLAVSGDGSTLYVSRFITPLLPDESTLSPDVSALGGELLEVDAAAMTLTDLIPLMHSAAPVTEDSGPGLPNYVNAPVISPDGAFAYLPSKQDNILAGNFRSGSNLLSFEQTVRAVTSRVDLSTNTELTGQRIDHDNAGLATGAVISNDGKFLYVALETSREVAIYNLQSGFEVTRAQVGRAPQGVALSPDNRVLYVYNFMDRTVSVHDLADVIDNALPNVPLLATVSVVGSEALAAIDLNGKQLFYDAADDRLAKDNYMSCASCHNDGAQDGRVWDFSQFGEGLRNTIDLRGKAGHGLLHWTANFDEVQDFENQIRSFAEGSGLMEQSAFDATEQTLGASKAGLSTDLDALAHYVENLMMPEGPNSSETLSSEAQAGETVFNNLCASCHTGAVFTDSATGARHDVGTISLATSGSRMGGPLDGFDTPTILGLWATAPYLHDGSAATVEDAITAHTTISLTPAELSSLTAYLDEVVEVTPQNLVGEFETSEDIGAVPAPGDATEDAGVYTVTSFGYDVTGTADEFHYVSSGVSGDGEIEAQVNSLVNSDKWAKAGVMYRESNAVDSAMVIVYVRSNGKAYLQYRDATGSASVQINPSSASGLGKYLRLTRVGDTFTGYYKQSVGDAWVEIGSVNVVMANSARRGLSVSSREEGESTTAEFEQLVLTP